MADHEETYYFNSRDATSSAADWTYQTSAVDGNTTTFAQCSANGKYLYYNGNSCTSVQLGLIKKVEFRTCGKVTAGTCSWCQVETTLRYNTTWISGTATVSTATATWSSYVDITTTTGAPAIWTFNNIRTLLNGADNLNQFASTCGTGYISKTEIRVTWRDPMALYQTNEETVLTTETIKTSAIYHGTGIVAATDDIATTLFYNIDVLEYVEEINNHLSLTILIPSSEKETFDDLLIYTGRCNTFNRPFNNSIAYDESVSSDNTIGFSINNCPSGITKLFFLIADSYESELMTGSNKYLYKLSGYKVV